MPATVDDQTRLRRSLSLYRLAAPLAVALLAPGFIRRMLRRGGFQNNFRQRFGHFSREDTRRLQEGSWTWIRSISVGETLVALKLAHALRAQCPELQIAISVTTSTGYELARKDTSPWLFAFYNPVDTQEAVERTLATLRPQHLVLVEGELWPNLMAACLQRRIPMMLANARLSRRSAGRFMRFRKWTEPFFNLLSWVGIPDEDDRTRWESVGMPPERITLTGSIKFDHQSTGDSRAGVFRRLLLPFEASEAAPLLLAGSTHDGEEVLLARNLVALRRIHPSLRLAIAPRHVERLPKILDGLAPFGFRVQLRSNLPSSDPWDVLILNTTGELRDWYPLATLVFVGKSLTAKGGQNPVEPALAGKAVIFGPHMENFEAVVQLLLNANAARQVPSETGLEAAVDDLLKNPSARSEMEANALEALKVHQGSAARTALLIKATSVPISG